VTASDRLGQTGGGGAGGGTTYYATASPDYGTPVSVVSIPRGGGAPTSPPIRGDQYVLQRILHGQASRGSGLLSLHDFSSNELGSTFLHNSSNKIQDGGSPSSWILEVHARSLKSQL